MSNDPVLKRLLEFETGLRAGGSAPGYEVLATYWKRNGDAPFAFCRDGLLLDPLGKPRFVPFVAIEDAGYYNQTMIERAKAIRQGSDLKPLSIVLSSGEIIDLPLEVRDRGMPDILQIARLIEQRTRISKAELRRSS